MNFKNSGTKAVYECSVTEHAQKKICLPHLPNLVEMINHSCACSGTPAQTLQKGMQSNISAYPMLRMCLYPHYDMMSE